jgi:hypothetical protein
MTTNNPIQPNNPHLALTAQEARRQDLNRLSLALTFIVPILLVAAIYSVTFFLPYLFSNFLETSLSGKIVILFVLAIILVAPAILGFVGFKIIFGGSEKYAKSFYNLPDEVNVKDLIRRRVYGLPYESPVAANMSSSFILVTNDKLDDKFSWASSFGGPAKLIIMDGYAVYLERGGKFSRVVGGMAFLERYETIREIIDLHPQIKELPIDCWTKDGIKLNVHVLLECQIISTENSTAPQVEAALEADKRIYPVYEKAVQAAVETASVAIWLGKDGKPEKYDWVAGVCGNIEGHIRTHTRSNTINDLLRAEATGQTEVKQPLQRKTSKEITATRLLSSEFRELIYEKCNKEIERLGARLINLHILKVENDILIDNQWKENWSAEWKSLNTITKGEAKAYNIRTKEKAHATAQKDMILAIAGSLENLDKKEMREHLILSLSGMLESSLVDPYVRAALPRETLETLEKLQNYLQEEKG